MEKKIFEPCELTVQSFADIIATSGEYSGTNGTYDIYGNWIPFGGGSDEV